jgi:hypothetical protein
MADAVAVTVAHPEAIAAAAPQQPNALSAKHSEEQGKVGNLQWIEAGLSPRKTFRANAKSRFMSSLRLNGTGKGMKLYSRNAGMEYFF